MSRWPRTMVLRSTPDNSRPGPVAPARTTRPPRRASWMARRAAAGGPADSTTRHAPPKPASPAQRAARLRHGIVFAADDHRVGQVLQALHALGAGADQDDPRGAH